MDVSTYIVLVLACFAIFLFIGMSNWRSQDDDLWDAAEKHHGVARSAMLRRAKRPPAATAIPPVVHVLEEQNGPTTPHAFAQDAAQGLTERRWSWNEARAVYAALPHELQLHWKEAVDCRLTDCIDPRAARNLHTLAILYEHGGWVVSPQLAPGEVPLVYAATTDGEEEPITACLFSYVRVSRLGAQVQRFMRGSNWQAGMHGTLITNGIMGVAPRHPLVRALLAKSVAYFVEVLNSYKLSAHQVSKYTGAMLLTHEVRGAHIQEKEWRHGVRVLLGDTARLFGRSVPKT